VSTWTFSATAALALASCGAPDLRAPAQVMDIEGHAACPEDGNCFPLSDGKIALDPSFPQLT